MKLTQKLKELWDKAGKALAGTPPANSMMASDVQYIGTKLREQTGFEVMAMDTRLVNGRKNVGIIMAQDTPADKMKQADDVFIAAAKERGIDIAPENVVRYLPGATFQPWRNVGPQPKTW